MRCFAGPRTYTSGIVTSKSMIRCSKPHRRCENAIEAVRISKRWGGLLHYKLVKSWARPRPGDVMPR
jgi:hypothetical protein